MLNYCTLFDSNFLIYGLAMYKSLKRCNSAFHLYVVAFDDKAFNVLSDLQYGQITVIRLEDFEDKELLSIKSTRTAGEYCWTCTPSVIKYCLETFRLDHCTYIDADLCFFNDPAVMYKELEEAGADVLITSHNYAAKYDQSEASGIYCVQYMTFKNTSAGLGVLNWWRNACIDWCYARIEDGKFGDQKYLDDWTTRFDCVHVSTNHGAGMAPWNAMNYDLEEFDGKYILKHIHTKEETPLVFYHFHSFRFYANVIVVAGHYELQEPVVEKIYKPYIAGLQDIINSLNTRNDTAVKLASTDRPVRSSFIIGKLFVKDIVRLVIYLMKSMTGLQRKGAGQFTFLFRTYHVYNNIGNGKIT